MGTIPGAALVLTMIDKLRGHGSWSGETHLQKAMFFFDHVNAKGTSFDFVLYKHGPYSFDLHDTLSLLFALSLLEHESVPPYGPRIRLTNSGKRFLAQHDELSDGVKTDIRNVAGWLGNKGVSDLEKFATALWVTMENPQAEQEARARRIHDIKPHISIDQARYALQQIGSMPARSA